MFVGCEEGLEEEGWWGAGWEMVMGLEIGIRAEVVGGEGGVGVAVVGFQ